MNDQRSRSMHFRFVTTTCSAATPKGPSHGLSKVQPLNALIARYSGLSAGRALLGPFLPQQPTSGDYIGMSVSCCQ